MEYVLLIFPEISQNNNVRIENNESREDENGRTRQEAIADKTAADSKKKGFLLITMTMFLVFY
jgi:hypothetical protein